jgi:hypothetical protein
MKVKTDTRSPSFPGKLRKCGMVRKPCKGERSSPLALVAMVSTAPSWLLLALQMPIIGWVLEALVVRSLSWTRTRPADTVPPVLLEPKFVKVFWIPESENPDDDKIYFFFRESAVEAAPAMGRMSVSRVGQICRVRRH